MKLYLVITADRYEHIIDFDSNPRKLAKRLGININTLYSRISLDTKGDRSGYRLCRIEIDESED